MAKLASVVVVCILHLTISSCSMASSVLICVHADSSTILVPSYEYEHVNDIDDVCIDHFNNTNNEWMTHYNHSSISCETNHSCSIVCMENNSCQSLPIYCDEDTQCHIYCTANESCASSVIDASYSTSLALHCNGYHSCRNVHIYCPSDSNASYCHIQGSDQSTQTSLHIYSTNGWEGIGLSQYETNMEVSNDNRMFCGYPENNDSCIIATEQWNCADDTDHCVEPQLKSFDYSSTNDMQIFNFNSTTLAPDDNTAVYIGSGVVAFLVIIALCCLCACAQYRRKQETLHQLEKKESNKRQFYGDDGLDDTLYVGAADETIRFTKSVYNEKSAGTVVEEQKSFYIETQKSTSNTESDLDDEFL